MRKNLLFAFLLCTCLSTYAQETEDNSSSEHKNDIMIDPIFMIAGPILNASYEHLMNADYGIGVNGLFGFASIEDFSQISPYVRLYLGKNYASGFFIEGFIPITTSNYDLDTYIPDREQMESISKKETTVGFGIGMGGKWALKKNILIELSSGVARRFAYKGDDEGLTWKGTLGIGYRF